MQFICGVDKCSLDDVRPVGIRIEYEQMARDAIAACGYREMVAALEKIDAAFVNLVCLMPHEVAALEAARSALSKAKGETT